MVINENMKKTYDVIARKNGIKYFNPNEKYHAICEAITNSHEPNCPFLGWQIGVYELVEIKKNFASFYLVDTLIDQVPYIKMKPLLRKKIRVESNTKVTLVAERTFVLIKDDNSNIK